MNRRCKYHCTVEDAEGIPSFTIRVEDVEHKEELVFRGKTPRGNETHCFFTCTCVKNYITFFVFPTDVWQQILGPILNKRKEAGLINLFPQYITGEVSKKRTVTKTKQQSLYFVGYFGKSETGRLTPF